MSIVLHRIRPLAKLNTYRNNLWPFLSSPLTNENENSASTIGYVEHHIKDLIDSPLDCEKRIFDNTLLVTNVYNLVSFYQEIVVFV